MEHFDLGGEIKITGISDFDLEKTFECGQSFRWDSDIRGMYAGVAMGRAAQLRREGDSIFISCPIEDFENIWREYFDLERDYAKIRQRLCVDEFMQKATEFGKGIRILRQDSWEALCSFIISQCNNIPRIKGIIATLCREFGERLDFMGKDHYTFPPASKIATLEESDLRPLRAGYRASYIISAAKAVAIGKIDLAALEHTTPNVARSALKKLKGVGDKVADCTMLFGLNMLDTFPKDVWIKRAITDQYGPDFDPKIFHPHAGIAQQYIFHYTRSNY